ncbi:hypothetical protein [Elizabethkingia meningoseptica]|uniref:hypothetical protein n=1 Tax=Elizabethkingia meningoseptica TaxID=238 RepID=UPI000994E272|nr:hypothetical protein [Elizabethkingia meningoseptica]MCT4085503.1 hypothetical protein [Elizabethkingia anophelis]AQX12504.1 hypothetical protein BBD35_09030 [Elizabethkingia meningoseptica]MBG0514046.1 hypothetical protein [Elizabethkingia meningoseptica]MCT4156941.1 hypothetical protein [Elizabethkingia anophelis]MCT4171262.1 hypothetical protein [Elizabethkingia anophelis]
MTDFKQDRNTEIFQKAVQYLSLRFPNKEISERTNYDKSNVSNFLKGKKPVPDDFLNNFFTTFELNKNDFVTDSSKELYNNTVSNDLLPPSGSKVKVPYYDVDFSGGWSSDEVFSMAPPSFYITSPNFERAEFACNLSGNSISQIIPSGSVVGFKEIFNWQTYFLTNELYGIVTKNDLRTVKLVKRSKENKNNLVLIPCPLIEYDKAGYESEEIPMDFVARFYQVIAWAKFERLVM